MNTELVISGVSVPGFRREIHNARMRSLETPKGERILEGGETVVDKKTKVA